MKVRKAKVTFGQSGLRSFAFAGRREQHDAAFDAPIATLYAKDFGLRGVNEKFRPSLFQTALVRESSLQGRAMEYRCETTSLKGFVQQLASNILPHGYWFYVTGQVPEGKEPQVVDRKLLAKYGIGISRQQRARRKLAGFANLHYLRLGRSWVLLATHGRHEFFDAEASCIRDVRRVPIQVGGYSLAVKQGHFIRKKTEGGAPIPDNRMRVRVQIGRERYRDICAYFLSIACHRSVENMGRDLWAVPFEPYAPIRRQLLNLLRLVNRKRQTAGYAKLPPTLIRYRREIVQPFAVSAPSRATDVGNDGEAGCASREVSEGPLDPRLMFIEGEVTFR